MRDACTTLMARYTSAVASEVTARGEGQRAYTQYSTHSTQHTHIHTQQLQCHAHNIHIYVRKHASAHVHLAFTPTHHNTHRVPAHSPSGPFFFAATSGNAAST